MRMIIRILLLVLSILLLGLVTTHNCIANEAMAIRMREATKFPLEISVLHAGTINGLLVINDLRISNPPDFTERALVETPDFCIKYKAISARQSAADM